MNSTQKTIRKIFYDIVKVFLAALYISVSTVSINSINRAWFSFAVSDGFSFENMIADGRSRTIVLLTKIPIYTEKILTNCYASNKHRVSSLCESFYDEGKKWKFKIFLEDKFSCNNWCELCILFTRIWKSRI